LTDAGKMTATAAALGLTTGGVFAAESNTINIALVGCGGRGTGAAMDALNSHQGPVKLVAMADVFPNRLKDSLTGLQKRKSKQVEVPESNQFVSFDGYKKAMDCLKPGDVVILATPPAFRWVHFTYAIEKGLNVFMEKPIAVDAPSCHKMFKLALAAKEKNLKCAIGLMCRHSESRGELAKRIKDGALGDLNLMRAYRMAGPTASDRSIAKPDGITELLYQIQRFHSFLWASGGCYSDFLIHNIDEACWMKDAFPVKAHASGGRQVRVDPGSGKPYVDQNFDHYSVEYTFADGAKFYLEGRTISGCAEAHSTYVHGAKGSAVVSEFGHLPARTRIYKDQDMTGKAIWDFERSMGREETNPYQDEWEHLMAAIRKDAAYNEIERGTEASLATAMGRMAAHTGQIITRDEFLKCTHEFAPDVDKLTFESAAPVQMVDGVYPPPQPGKTTRREF
jgi:predicted dehydrogenase